VPGIRAVYANTPEEAIKTREHNDANVLCLSGWKQSAAEARALINTFIGTRFTDEERHARRIEKISEYENR